MIHSLNLDSFYLTEEQLENSPSRQDGIDKDTEANLRMYGCQVIQEAGIMLGFDQVVMATGQVLLHRFYCKRSMKTFNVKKMAATALWVAAKLEEVKEVREHPRKLIEMVMVAVDRCITRRETPEGRKLAVLDSHSKEGEEFRRALIRYESEMLKAFGFIMNVEHPHRLLCNYCQIIFTPYMGKADKRDFLQDFIQQAWNIANDSLRTNLCVRFKGSVVACGIIFYAARKLQVSLPDDWWELFLVKLEDMCEVCRILHELYLAPKPHFIPVCHQLLPSKPPTPAIGGAAVKGTAVTATPTPMLGASPALGTRPGDKPLDPSVRRTIPASESTPNLAAAGAAAGAAANGAAGSTLASPEGAAAAAAPGSARKRSRSRSPHDDSRKRQQLEPRAPPQGAGQPQSQPDQQRPQASEAAAGEDGMHSVQQPRSAAGDRDREQERERGRDRDSKRPDRDVGRSSHRDRPRSHSRDKRRRSSSRDRSRRSRSRSRDRRGGHRDKSRRSRSRDRKRSRSRDRRRSRSRSPDRRRDARDSRGRSTHDRADRRDRPDGGRDERGRQRESPAKPKPKEQQQQQQDEGTKFPAPPADRFPSPPPEPASTDAAGRPTEQDAAGKAAAAAGDSSKAGSKANGVGSSRSEQVSEEDTGAAQPSQAARDDRAGLPPVQPKPKPKAVRKQQPAGGVTSPVTSPGGSQDGKPPAGAAGTAD